MSISGPAWMPGSSGLPIRSWPNAALSCSVISLRMLSCTIRRRSEVQRWPDVPAAAKVTPRRTRSRLADGVTMAHYCPPAPGWSGRAGPRLSGQRSCPSWCCPVALISATRGSACQLCSDIAATRQKLEQVRGALRGILRTPWRIVRHSPARREETSLKVSRLRYCRTPARSSCPMTRRRRGS